MAQRPGEANRGERLIAMNVFIKLMLYQASTCTDFAAIKMANSKNTKGLRVTGVGAIVCARHGLIHPNGLGDLQKGERCVTSTNGCLCL
jgi:hypothetical protein